MKNLNKKGFFMTETLMVIVFATLIFTFLYISVIPLVGNYNDKIARESDIDIVYKLYSVRKALNKDNNKKDMINSNVKSITCNNFSNKAYCEALMEDLELTNYTFLYTKSISSNYNNINTNYPEIGEYLKNYQDEDEEAVILLDNNKHTIAHLTYIDPNMELGDLLLYKAGKKDCNPIFKDTDGVNYFSGTNECIDFNYLWYSGKLWRITAIYPDGSMKMITEDALTAINWGSTVEYDGSWVYQWLNEDFYDTLVNPSDILVSNATWNYSTDGNSTPVRPESIATQKTKEAPIGLLNLYEYYNAYRNASTSTNYLNIGYYWWLITPYSTLSVRGVYNSGNLNYLKPASSCSGVRPSINLKSGLEFTGSGSKSDPYKIKGDMEGPTNNITLLSSRSIGEYVKFDNDIYRIVSIDEENGTTKLTRVDYLRNNGTVITKKFASTVYFGKSTNTGSDTYWDYYLNNTWYNSISSTYKDMLIDGTYYLGLYDESGKHYKITTCKDTASTLDNITTKNCTKYTSEDTNKTFTGKVGLPRVGEMFSAQFGSGHSSSSHMWLITPCSTSYVREVFSLGLLYRVAPTNNSDGVRPSINLKSGIKITGGIGYVGGETNSPFEISE